MAEPSEHDSIVREIRSLRSQVRHSGQQLEPFVKALAAALDGIDIEGITDNAKERFMSETEKH